jgi:phage shock protein PspC (stress-responsive transcriptional regulator)
MAGGDETRDDQWGNKTARITFIVTVLCAVLFVGAVAFFILNSDVRPPR